MTSNKRPQCEACGFLQSQCVCAWIPSLTTRLKILVVQDGKEALHAKNTVALLRLALPSVECVDSADVTCLSHLDVDAWRLLFPGQGATPVESVTEDQKSHIEGIILIDATWRKAKKLLLSEPLLQRFTTLSFEQPPVGAYAIRKSPNDQALSTLEACAYCIEQLCAEDMQGLRDFMQQAQAWQWRRQPKHHQHL
ncbi:tRNA-uridine aminocarboxypropyltransferase [Marinomonas aquiplantarum]|uniref:tRNA-uridine aminocarboxypropyltransferase n=1 Tax=Marinomonas aquiplantarum TaxID=491951 RepID=A0A366CYF6_9GAMM|nr:tRNA-uridine aminocarboxypropyltransferase [Marinomonas aquiplantarum]RBO82239.1 DTW domain-containing protein YfiP [Marinomonas aquiplantarum]